MKKKVEPPSSLDKLKIRFEFDKPLSQIKRELRQRTAK